MYDIVHTSGALRYAQRQTIVVRRHTQEFAHLSQGLKLISAAIRIS
jgi:hypothetical protein